MRCDPKVLTVISLNWPRKLGSRECTGHIVQNPGADTEMRGSQKNLLIWKGHESAQGDKRKEILGWVEGGARASAGGKGWFPRPSGPHGLSLDAGNGPLIHLLQEPLPYTLHWAASIHFKKCK